MERRAMVCALVPFITAAILVAPPVRAAQKLHQGEPAPSDGVFFTVGEVAEQGRQPAEQPLSLRDPGGGNTLILKLDLPKHLLSVDQEGNIQRLCIETERVQEDETPWYRNETFWLIAGIVISTGLNLALHFQ